MSDNYGSSGEVTADLSAAGEQPVPGQTEEVTPTPQPTPQVLSPTQVQQMIAQALDQNNQAWSRQIQSQMDKRAQAIQNNVLKQVESSKAQAEQVVKMAKENGIDDAAAAALGQKFLSENINTLLAEAQQPPQRNGQQQQQPPPEQYEQQQINEANQVAMYQAWITNQGDQLRDAFSMPYDAPEMSQVVTHLGEQEYFDSIKEAGRKYQQRMAKSGQPARPARAPGLGPDGATVPQNSIASIDNTSELYKLAAKQAREQPRR